MSLFLCHITLPAACTEKREGSEEEALQALKVMNWFQGGIHWKRWTLVWQWKREGGHGHCSPEGCRRNGNEPGSQTAERRNSSCSFEMKAGDAMRNKQISGNEVVQHSNANKLMACHSCMLIGRGLKSILIVSAGLWKGFPGAENLFLAFWSSCSYPGFGELSGPCVPQRADRCPVEWGIPRSLSVSLWWSFLWSA